MDHDSFHGRQPQNTEGINSAGKIYTLQPAGTRSFPRPSLLSGRGRAKRPHAHAFRQRTCFLHSHVGPVLSKPDASTSTPRREKHTDHQLVEADTSQSGNVEKSCEIGWEGQGEYLSTIVMCIQICSISRVLQLRSRSCLTAFPGSMLFYDIVARKSALLLPYP